MNALFDDFLRSPRMFPDRFDFDDGTLHFCQMTPQTYADSPWLDQRKISVDGMYYKLAVDAVLQQLGAARPADRRRLYVFHTSHCCSTLLARCLGAIPGCFSLKEPLILRQLSELKRSGIFPNLESSGQWQQLVELVAVLLSRTFGESDVALVKATSVCHNLMDELLGRYALAQGIFLYSGLQDYLVSMYKEPGRLELYLDAYYPLLTSDMRRLGFQARLDLNGLTIPQQAALMWVARVMTFAEYTSRHGALVSLDCNLFLEEPSGVMGRLCEHFGMSADQRQIEEVVTGPLMRKEAKHGRLVYDARVRTAESETVLRRFAVEIDAAMQWAETCLPDPGWLYRLPFGLDGVATGRDGDHS